jgi:hypothetical protein
MKHVAYICTVFHQYFLDLGCYVVNMKRVDVLDKIKEVGINNPNLCSVIEEEVKIRMNVHDLEDLKGKIKTFVAKLKIKYHKHRRTFSRLEEHEKEWLALELYARPAPPTSRPGRPTTPWTDSSERTKRRKVSRYIKIYMLCFWLLILYKKVYFFLNIKYVIF